MTLEEIKAAVESGQTVCYKSLAYRVIKDDLGQWFIHCPATQYSIGLTWRNNITLNGKPGDFFIAQTPSN